VAQGVPISSIHNTIAAAFGSAYVNDFIQAGRVKRVYVQADAPYRMLPTDLERLHVRNTRAGWSPFPPLPRATGRPVPRAGTLQRLPVHQHPGRGGAGPKLRRGHAGHGRIRPGAAAGVGYDWQGLSYQERMASSQAPLLYAFSIFVIFLCLAALYESWPIPISILLVLPLGVIGGVIASSVRGLPNDVYFQIGLLTTLGLTTKNAILIVQFAKAGVEQGMGLVDAPWRGETALPPDHHDLACLRFRCAAAGCGDRRRGGGPECHRHGRAGGMVTATVLVIIFCSAFLRADRDVFGKRSRREAPLPAAPSHSLWR